MIAWSVSRASSMTQSDSAARRRMSSLIASTRRTNGDSYSPSSHSGTAGTYSTSSAM